MVAGLAGVVLLVGWQPEPWNASIIAGILACLAAAACYGVASVYAKARMGGVPSAAIALYSQLCAALVLAPALPFAAVPAMPAPLVAANVLAWRSPRQRSHTCSISG